MSQRGLPPGAPDIPKNYLEGKWAAAKTCSSPGIAMPIVILMAIAVAVIVVTSAMYGI